MCPSTARRSSKAPPWSGDRPITYGRKAVNVKLWRAFCVAVATSFLSRHIPRTLTGVAAADDLQAAVLCSIGQDWTVTTQRPSKCEPWQTSQS